MLVLWNFKLSQSVLLQSDKITIIHVNDSCFLRNRACAAAAAILYYTCYVASVRRTRTVIAEFGHFDPVTCDVTQPMAASVDNYELAYCAEN